MNYICLINRYLVDLDGHTIGYNVVEHPVEAQDRDGAITYSLDLVERLNKAHEKDRWGDEPVNVTYTLGRIVVRCEEKIIYEPDYWL